MSARNSTCSSVSRAGPCTPIVGERHARVLGCRPLIRCPKIHPPPPRHWPYRPPCRSDTGRRRWRTRSALDRRGSPWRRPRRSPARCRPPHGQDGPARRLRHVAFEDVQVGAEDRAGVDADDDVGRRPDRGVLDGVPTALTGRDRRELSCCVSYPYGGIGSNKGVPERSASGVFPILERVTRTRTSTDRGRHRVTERDSLVMERNLLRGEQSARQASRGLATADPDPPCSRAFPRPYSVQKWPTWAPTREVTNGSGAIDRPFRLRRAP